MLAILAILDACVLIPSARRDTLLRAAEKETYHLLWSDAILEEVRRNLIEDRSVPAAKTQRTIDEMRRTFRDASVTGYQSLVARMTNHQKDRHILAAAVAAGAEVIVTWNIRDFPVAALAPYHIKAATPDEFLVDLCDLYPDRLAGVIAEQAAFLRRPPLTVDELLALLGKTVPSFVQQVRPLLANLGGPPAGPS